MKKNLKLLSYGAERGPQATDRLSLTSDWLPHGTQAANFQKWLFTLRPKASLVAPPPPPPPTLAWSLGPTKFSPPSPLIAQLDRVLSPPFHAVSVVKVFPLLSLAG